MEKIEKKRKKPSIDHYMNAYIKKREGILSAVDGEQFTAYITRSDKRELHVIVDEEKFIIDKINLNYLVFKTKTGKVNVIKIIRSKGDKLMAARENETENEVKNIKKKYEMKLPSHLAGPKKGQVCNVFLNNGKVLKELHLVAMSTYEILFQRMKKDEPVTDVLVYKHAVNRVEYIVDKSEMEK